MTFLLALVMADALPVGGGIVEFRLESVERPKSCGAAGTSDIVVCGSRNDKDRLVELKPVGPAALPPLTLKLPGDAWAHAGMENESVGGFASKRAMVRVTIPF
jgi:hypothetical protein